MVSTHLLTTAAREFAPHEAEDREMSGLLKSVVVPRPIAWVSSQDAAGVLNLAPHSYFMLLAERPTVLGFVSSGRKDTMRNIEATGEYVVNILGEELVNPMNLTSADFPPDEDEFAWAGLTPEASAVVAVPRVAEAPVALETRLVEIKDYGDGEHPSYLVVGEVVHVRVHERIYRDDRVAPDLLRAVGRMGGMTYIRTTDRFDLGRPKYAELVATSAER